MKTLLNMRRSARLGAAFGFLVLALAVVAAVGLSGVGKGQRMRRQLGELIGEVSSGAGTVSAASEQMASTSDEAGRAVGEIASSAAELARTAVRLDQLVRRFKVAA